MGQRTNGGILGVANTPTTSSASGVWTLDEVAVFKKAGLWPSAATFSLAVDSATVNKGGSFTITLTTTGVADGTLVPYTITGIDAADLSSGSLTGFITVTSNTGTASFTTASSGGTSGNLTATFSCGGDTETITIQEGDTYFKYVTALLHGDGTNAAQNNTFLDSSTNTFSITRNGDTTQGTFSPYGDTWSNYFDGSGDYLSVADNAAFNFGTGNFTAEFWIYTQDQTNNYPGILSASTYSDTGALSIRYDNTGQAQKVFVYLYGASPADPAITSSTYAFGQWLHVAVVRDSTTSLKLYVNGTLDGSTTISSGQTVDLSGNGSLYIGRGFDVDTSAAYFNGYISNVRVVKGTAVYTGAFTPSTTSLTAITNTSLLTCQSNRFVDNSASPLTITANGDVKVQKFSPFSPTASYSTSVIGGSAYFDGSGDYLSVADGTALDLGAGDFTIEAWINTSSSAEQIFAAQWPGASNRAWVIALTPSSSTFLFAYTTNGTTQINTSATASIQVGAWTHIALCRSSTSLNFFVNGVLAGTASIGSNTIYNSSASMLIGSFEAGSTPFSGYISDFRVVKGTAVYTTAFTPSTAPLTAVSGTSLLCNFTNGGIIDNAMMNDWQTVGNAQISTSVKKYGSGSLAFDGTGDYLQAPHTTVAEFGSGNFTVEFWAYINAQSGAYTGVVGQWLAGAASSANSWNVLINAYNATNKLGFSYSDGSATTDFSFGSALGTGTWNHYAICRSGNLLYAFKDGVLLNSGGTSITATINNGTSNFRVGSVGTAGGGSDFNGYIDDLRITKGYARYTSNFTAPTGPFQDR